jgi:DNA-directed RNA polymerase subunit alpha
MIELELKMPKSVYMAEQDERGRYGKFILEPLERGFGTTVGNALRRILLASIPGAAVTAVRFEGALHEFTTLPGVAEDVSDVVLALKQLRLSMVGTERKSMRLDVRGEGEVTAADIIAEAGLDVLNPDLHLATLADDGCLTMEMRVELGRGYAPASELRESTDPLGLIGLDASFSPIERVTYVVEAARVGQRTDYDKLAIQIWTDGSVTPEQALTRAAGILASHLAVFGHFATESPQDSEGADEQRERIREKLTRPVTELELSVRSSNCLSNANIRTLADLVSKTEAEMLRYPNFGRKSLNEIASLLGDLGLRFGMNVDEYFGTPGARTDDEGE